MATQTRPRGKRTYGNPKAPMTEPQEEMLRDLLGSRDVDPAILEMIEVKLDEGMTRGAASAFISLLLTADRLAKDTDPTEEGWYQHDGVIYKVQRARKGHLYALQANEAGKYKDLASGAMRKLTCNDMLTDAQVRKLRLS